MRIGRFSPSSAACMRLLCFTLPALALAGIFAVLGVYPFGEKSLLVADLNNEYVDYLSLITRSLKGPGSLLRSWNMGMGLNMLGLVAFYAASPFCLLLLLFPAAWITEGILLITLLKVGLCGLFFSLYLEESCPLPLPLALALSLAYALNGYNIAYSSNLMWLDGVAFLPLVLLGVERLQDRRGSGVLAACLLYVFFTSYYIGYMIGLFALLYLAARHWAQARPARSLGKRGKLGKLGWDIAGLAGCAAVAAGCCAFLLLPAFFNLRDGQESLFLLQVSPELQYSFAQLLGKLLPGAFDTLTNSGTPNLYCTLAAAGGGILYFLNREIDLREKLCYGGVTLFLLLSCSWVTLYLGWHAFEDPTWYPARFSFLFCCWLLLLCARCAARSGGIRAPHGMGAGFLLLLLILEAAAGRYPFLESPSLLVAAGLLLLYPGLLLLWNKQGAVRLLGVVLVLAVGGESVYHAWTVVRGIDRRFRYRDRESYTGFLERSQPAIQELEALDGGVYRTEHAHPRNANGAMSLGYRSISHYSTTTDQALNGLLKEMGYNTGIINELYFAPNTPLANGLLGIRYVLSEEELAHYEPAWEGEGLGVYRNPAAFPLAFFAGESALDFHPADGANPFLLQNEWVGSLGDGFPSALYHPVEAVEHRHQAAREEREDHVRYANLSRDGEGIVEWTVSNPRRLPVYAYFPVYRRAFVPAVAETAHGAQRELSYRHNTVLYLGDDAELTVRLRFSGDRALIRDAAFYALDLPQAVEAAGLAGEAAVDFTTFRDTRLEGTVYAPHEGALLTTFPYDEGWRIRVDGVRVRPQRFAGVFLALPLEEGAHRLELRYRPPGFVAGCWISGLTVLGCLARLAWGIRRKKRRLP